MSLRRSLQALALLAVAGLGIAAYLTWTYTMGGSPVCLGGGGCATVQHSPYAWLMGLPVPALGGLLYVALIATAMLALRARAALQEMLLLALFGLSLAGLLFSAYLTYLEFYVIYAVCLWCVLSAVVMTAIFALALLAWRQFSQSQA